MVKAYNTGACIDPKRGDLVAPNSDSDLEGSLDEMRSVVNDS